MAAERKIEIICKSVWSKVCNNILGQVSQVAAWDVVCPSRMNVGADHLPSNFSPTTSPVHRPGHSQAHKHTSSIQTLIIKKDFLHPQTTLVPIIIILCVSVEFLAPYCGRTRLVYYYLRTVCLCFLVATFISNNNQSVHSSFFSPPTANSVSRHLL